MGLLKPEILKRAEDTIEIKFPARREFMIPGDVVQGGIVGAMLDMAMAFADDGGLSTASLQYDILRPVLGPDLFVTGRITKRGRRINLRRGRDERRER